MNRSGLTIHEAYNRLASGFGNALVYNYLYDSTTTYVYILDKPTEMLKRYTRSGYGRLTRGHEYDDIPLDEGIGRFAEDPYWSVEEITNVS
jgi:hypothetical protein